MPPLCHLDSLDDFVFFCFLKITHRSYFFLEPHGKSGHDPLLLLTKGHPMHEIIEQNGRAGCGERRA